MLQDGFELSMWLRMTLNFGYSCLRFPNAGIMGLCYQAQFIWHWGLNPGPGICGACPPATELYHQSSKAEVLKE